MIMKTMLSLAAASIALAVPQTAIAQDTDGSDPDVEAQEEANGAIVTREEITEERGLFDENGDPVLDDAGNPATETVTVGFSQTVETPSGIAHMVTKEDGSAAVVTHENLGAPERTARVAAAERPGRTEMPERPERAERPERPERAERPERPERPDRPERPNRPGAL
jgi:hypothetical protein